VSLRPLFLTGKAHTGRPRFAVTPTLCDFQFSKANHNCPWCDISFENVLAARHLNSLGLHGFQNALSGTVLCTFKNWKFAKTKIPKYRIPNSVRSVLACTGMSRKIITVEYGCNTHVQIVQCLKKCFPLSTHLLIWCIVSLFHRSLRPYIFVCLCRP
jgi:hypothetical protein